MTPQQQEYIITEEQIQVLLERRGGHYISCQGKFREEIFNQIRSRPSGPPCPHWGIEHSDGMEWVCNRPSPAPDYRNESICHICTSKKQEPYCQGCYHLKEHDAAIATAAREQVLDEFQEWAANGIDRSARCDSFLGQFIKKIQSRTKEQS
jgi:hypothetical protein